MPMPPPLRIQVYRCGMIVFEPLNLSVTEAGRRLGVNRRQLSDIVNCRTGISPEMANSVLTAKNSQRRKTEMHLTTTYRKLGDLNEGFSQFSHSFE